MLTKKEIYYLNDIIEGGQQLSELLRYYQDKKLSPEEIDNLSTFDLPRLHLKPSVVGEFARLIEREDNTGSWRLVRLAAYQGDELAKYNLLVNSIKLDEKISWLEDILSCPPSYRINGHFYSRVWLYQTLINHFNQFKTQYFSYFTQNEIEMRKVDYAIKYTTLALRHHFLFRSVPGPDFVVEAMPINESTILPNVSKPVTSTKSETGEITPLPVPNSEHRPHSAEKINSANSEKSNEEQELLPQLKTLTLSEKDESETAEGVYSCEIQRQIQTELRFFNPARTKNPIAREISRQIQKNRIVYLPSKVQSVQIGDMPTRMLITAEAATIKSSLDYLNIDCKFIESSRQWYFQYNFWHNRGNDRAGIPPCTGRYGNHEKVSLGLSDYSYQQRTNPHYNHRGDFIGLDLEHYGDENSPTSIYGFLNKLLCAEDESRRENNERKLAHYMLKFARHGEQLHLRQLKKINSKATSNDVTQMNKLFYHVFVKEVARWSFPLQNQTQAPFALANLRAVKLIADGHLKITDVFKQNAPFGVFAGKKIKENFSTLIEKIKKINILYCEKYIQPNPKRHDKRESGEQIYYLSKRSELHSELQEFCGGENDSDGDGYDSETANNEYPEITKLKF